MVYLIIHGDFADIQFQMCKLSNFFYHHTNLSQLKLKDIKKQVPKVKNMCKYWQKIDVWQHIKSFCRKLSKKITFIIQGGVLYASWKKGNPIQNPYHFIIQLLSSCSEEPQQRFKL